jgi:NitT/TauT family transport system permease protein
MAGENQKIKKGDRENWGARLANVAWPLAFIAGAAVLWEILVRALHIPKWLLPALSVVLLRIGSDAAFLSTHAAYTLYVILSGFLLAIAVGVPIALLISSWRVAEKALYPLLVFSQTVPKIAIAPLFAIWLGMTSLPHILITLLISFFPIVIDTVAGLKSLPLEMIQLSQSMGTTRWQMFRKVRLPFALPFLFAGLKVAITLAVVGAIVGEWVGSEKGLGYVLLLANGQLDTALAFSAIIVLTLMGMGLFFVVWILEKLLISWHVSERLKEIEGI